MKKTQFMTLLVVLLLLAMPSFASESLVEDTIRAMGIINGDLHGNMRLGYPVTRAEFAHIMVKASSFSNQIDAVSNTSVFRDVRHTHWAANSIKIAVEQGWFNGYLDGTFKPDAYITLEEAATATLRLIGFTPEELRGVYPITQLNLYEQLALNKSITRTQGQTMIRRDVMHLYYNLMSVETKSGRLYGDLLGYPMIGSELDYITILDSTTVGPQIYNSGKLQDELPFRGGSISVYRDGSLSSLARIMPYDVYYYNSNMRTVWVYSQKVTGQYTVATPTTFSPTSVMVAGSNYQLATNEARIKLSSRGSFVLGDQVTLLIGAKGEVVDVLAPEQSNEILYGIVTAFEKTDYKDSLGRIIINNSIKLVTTHGDLRQYSTGQQNFSVGNIVSVNHTDSQSIIKRMTSNNISGTFNEDLSRFGSYVLAENFSVIDTTFQGASSVIRPISLKGVTLAASDIRYFSLDKNNKIDGMILNNVTGDLGVYGLVTEVEETETVIPNPNPLLPPTLVKSGLYTYSIGSKPGVLSSSEDWLGIYRGAAVFNYTDNKVSSIRNMSGINLESLNAIEAKSNMQIYDVAPDVQVYQYISGEYYAVTLETVADTNFFNVIGYRDSGHRAGGKVRIIIATRK